MSKVPLNRKVLITLLFKDSLTQIKINRLWTKYEKEILLSINRNGKLYTLEKYKAGYIFLRNLILDLSTNPVPFTRSDKNKIPKILWTLRPLLKNDSKDFKRIALCIAREYEQMHLPIDYSLDTIETPLGETLEYQETCHKFNFFLEVFTDKYEWYKGYLVTPTDNMKISSTLGKGPNGPAVAYAGLDIAAVKENKNLHQALYQLNSCLGMSLPMEMFEKNDMNLDNRKYNYITSKLGFSSEPGGKTRVFAIGDYWTQFSLKPIQISLDKILRSISTDATHEQNKGFKSLLSESIGKDTYCFDLSAASDRIPAKMQKFRMELLGGKALSESWYTIMTDRDFYIPDLKKNVRWGVGQPLGFLSSFPSFALWHHDIVQYAYNSKRMDKGLPLKFFKDYRMLGDDVVIWDTEVANEYHRLITDVFKININLNKSVIGKGGKSQIEFTKRLALNGIEMSSIKRNILHKNSKLSLLDLVDILRERDYIPSEWSYCTLSGLLSSEQSELVNFFLWFRSSSRLPFEGDNQDLMIEKDFANLKVKEARLAKIKEKTLLLDGYLNAAKPLEDYFKQQSLPYSNSALGLTNVYDPNGLHPLVVAINQTGMDLLNIMDAIWDDDPRDDVSLEYLPLISTKSYFHSEKQKGEYLSRIIIDVYTNLKQENSKIAKALK
jgi:hypothetical protein